MSNRSPVQQNKIFDSSLRADQSLFATESKTKARQTAF